MSSAQSFQFKCLPAFQVPLWPGSTPLKRPQFPLLGKHTHLFLWGDCAHFGGHTRHYLWASAPAIFLSLPLFQIVPLHLILAHILPFLENFPELLQPSFGFPYSEHIMTRNNFQHSLHNLACEFFL